MTSASGGTVLVFLDPAHPAGRLVDADKPQLFATDLGVTRGDGVFESLLVLNGQVRKPAAHLTRLARSAQLLDLAISDQASWAAALDTAVVNYLQAHPGTAEFVVKLLVSRGREGEAGPVQWVQASAAPSLGQQQRERGVDVLLLDRGYDSEVAERAPWLLLGAKTLSYAVNMAALRHAKAHGAEDVIFTSSDGRVLEGPTSTVLLAKVSHHPDGTQSKRLITPSLDSGILPGTSQGALFAAARDAGWELGYGPLTPEDLFSADALWLISSIRLIAPVNRVDGREIGSSPELARALTAELNELFLNGQ